MHAKARDNGEELTPFIGAAELETHVQYRLGRQVRNFQLIFAHKGLVLRGRAKTYYAKQLAQHAVLEATKLPIWANEIEVV